ncbi:MULTISPECIES: LamG-like jellyroll fold domain-containing protein [Cryobacterium]|nr:MULTISPECIES: LamG-like jellyroll fold domain-containing protein [Cryobacterium]
MLSSAVSLLIWAALPAAIGWLPTTVASDSMAPRIRAGDVVVAMPVDDDDLRVGQVLLVDDPDHDDRFRLHRMVASDGTGALVLQGDANPTVDTSTIPRDAVRGVGVIRVPFAGFPGIWLRDGAVLPLVVFFGAVATLLLATRLDRRIIHPVEPAVDPPDADMPPDDNPPVVSTDNLPGATSPRSGRSATFVVLAVLACTLISTATATADAAFTGPTANPTTTLAADAAYPCLTKPTPADTPFFFYRFTGTSGTIATDWSGNNRNGTFQGGARRAAGSCETNASPALTLDGVSGYVSTPTTVAGLNVFSLELWFKTAPGYTQGGKLIGFGNSQLGQSSSYDRHIYMNANGNLIFGVYPGAAKVITSPVSYNTGNWTHVVATLSPAGMRLLVNGTLVASDTTVTTAAAYSGFWKIGYDNLTSWPGLPPRFFFQGTIDNAAVYTTALTDAQVNAHRTTGH